MALLVGIGYRFCFSGPRHWFTTAVKGELLAAQKFPMFFVKPIFSETTEKKIIVWLEWEENSLNCTHLYDWNCFFVNILSSISGLALLEIPMQIHP